MITTLILKRRFSRYFLIWVVGAFLIITAIGLTPVAGYAAERAGGPNVTPASSSQTAVPCDPIPSAGPQQAVGGNEIQLADHLQTCTEVCKQQCGTDTVGDWVCRQVCKLKCVGGSKGHGDPRKPSK